jgi:drug/metabolite transporter (DMT)-like permease
MPKAASWRARWVDPRRFAGRCCWPCRSPHRCWHGILRHPVDVAAVSPAAWVGLAYVTAISMFVGFFFWYRGLALGGIARVGQVQLLQPFMSLLGAAVLLGERLALNNCLFALAVIGVVCAGRRLQVRRQAS